MGEWKGLEPGMRAVGSCRAITTRVRVE